MLFAQIEVKDLELIRDTLSVVRNYFQMQDIQYQAVALADNPRYSPLTTQISHAAERVDGILKDHLLAEHDAAEGWDESNEESFYESDDWSGSWDEEIEEFANKLRDEGVPLEQRQAAIEQFKDIRRRVRMNPEPEPEADHGDPDQGTAL